jgi:hypothetical protein
MQQPNYFEVLKCLTSSQSWADQVLDNSDKSSALDKLHTLRSLHPNKFTVWSVSAMSTSSSSSEDEDLEKFASVAVSAEQIQIQSRVEAQKGAAQATRAPIFSGARPAAVSAAAAAVAGTTKHDDEEVTGLDLVSVKV